MLRWREKSPGLKILWIWTFGTAAVLVTSVMRTRLQDMERLMKEQDEMALRSPSNDASAVAAAASDSAD